MTLHQAWMQQAESDLRTAVSVDHHDNAIELLDSLVPVYPDAGHLAARNHEYPFQETRTEWHAPSEADAFTRDEMRRIRYCANSLVPKLRRILEALDLLYP